MFRRLRTLFSLIRTALRLKRMVMATSNAVAEMSRIQHPINAPRNRAERRAHARKRHLLPMV